MDQNYINVKSTDCIYVLHIPVNAGEEEMVLNLNVLCICSSYLSFRFPMSIVVCLFFGFIWIYGLESPDPESIPYYGVGVLCFCLNTIITTLARPHFIIGQCHLFNRLRVIHLLPVFIIHVSYG